MTERVPGSYRIAIALTLFLFALWGFAHRLYDTLLPDFAAALALDATKTSVAQWALSGGYYVMALPAAFVTRNFGFKSGLVFGLGCFAVGLFLFYPAAEAHLFVYFLGAAVVIGSGLAILEVSADPLVVRLGAKETAVRRLNIAQALNPVGVVMGYFAGHWIVSAQAAHPAAHSLVMPLSLIGAGVLAFAFLVDNTRFPAIAQERAAKADSTLKSFASLLRQPHFQRGLGAQFLCAVAQIVLWGFTIRYAVAADAAGNVLLWSLLAFTLGRIAGTALMFRFSPARLLFLFAGCSAAFTAVAAFAGGRFGIECLIAASFFLSIQFPTIFASTIRDLGDGAKSGSALLMFAAGSGAAVLALLDIAAVPVQQVMIVPALAFAGVAAFAGQLCREERFSAGPGPMAHPIGAAGADRPVVRPS